MILSDTTIRELVNNHELATNVKDINIQPASLDITIGDTFSCINNQSTIVTLGERVEYTTTKSDTYILLPHHFILATTEQYLKLPNNVSAFVEGRSSIGRLGLFIQNAGWIDAGFEGEITLELYNACDYPIRLTKGYRVGQIVFAYMDKGAENPYRGKYQGQTGATGSRIYLDKE